MFSPCWLLLFHLPTGECLKRFKEDFFICYLVYTFRSIWFLFHYTRDSDLLKIDVFRILIAKFWRFLSFLGYNFLFIFSFELSTDKDTRRSLTYGKRQIFTAFLRKWGFLKKIKFFQYYLRSDLNDWLLKLGLIHYSTKKTSL